MSRYNREGGDGSEMYQCPLCLRVELNSYEGWLYHLGTREHQVQHLKCMTPFYNPKGYNKQKVLERCIDVHGIFGLKCRQLLDYFKTWGQIEDFSYWFKKGGEDGQAVRCVVLYKEREAAESCIKDKQHVLNDVSLEVTPFRGSSGNIDRSRNKRKSDERGDRDRESYKHQKKE